MTKPWFLAQADGDGRFEGGHVDEDIYFWRRWEDAGNTLGMATNVSVGHAELMITWPSRSVPGGKMHQYTTDFWTSRKPPEGAWGYVG
jgi:hypothetical protein